VLSFKSLICRQKCVLLVRGFDAVTGPFRQDFPHLPASIVLRLAPPVHSILCEQMISCSPCYGPFPIISFFLLSSLAKAYPVFPFPFVLSSRPRMRLDSGSPGEIQVSVRPPQWQMVDLLTLSPSSFPDETRRFCSLFSFVSSPVFQPLSPFSLRWTCIRGLFVYVGVLKVPERAILKPIPDKTVFGIALSPLLPVAEPTMGH